MLQYLSFGSGKWATRRLFGYDFPYLRFFQHFYHCCIFKFHSFVERFKLSFFCFLLGSGSHCFYVHAAGIQNIERVIVTDEILTLASKYVAEKVVGKTSFDDCVHIATATIYKADILVSWNFKHIVNVYRIRGYNSINIRSNYPSLEIRSPKEILEYED